MLATGSWRERIDGIENGRRRTERFKKLNLLFSILSNFVKYESCVASSE